MYTHFNFKTKKALKEAVQSGKRVTYYQPGPFGGDPPQNGTITLEGPHYPEPHKFYCQAEAKDGVIVRILK